MLILSLIATGLFAGLLGSLLGLGGGVIIVPALTLIFNMPVTEAVGTSLTAIVAVSTIAAADFLKSGRADLELGMTLETASASGALIGGTLAGFISPRYVYILFSLILFLAAYNMARPKRGSDIDSSDYYPVNKGLGLTFSFFAGNLSGLLGVGGGVIKVPLMTGIMKVPMKIATATSSYMIGITAAPAAIVYLLGGHLDIIKTSALIIGAFAGSRLGAALSYKINTLALRLLFVALILYTSVRMILKGI